MIVYLASLSLIYLHACKAFWTWEIWVQQLSNTMVKWFEGQLWVLVSLQNHVFDSSVRSLTTVRLETYKLRRFTGFPWRGASVLLTIHLYMSSYYNAFCNTVFLCHRVKMQFIMVGQLLCILCAVSSELYSLLKLLYAGISSSLRLLMYNATNFTGSSYQNYASIWFG